MKIRNRITLWITLTGLLSTLVLSLIIFFEMAEQPYELLDQELEINARALVTKLHLDADGSLQNTHPANPFISPYWVRIFDGGQRVRFESNLVQFFDIPFRRSKKAYTDNIFGRLGPGREYADEPTAFRVRIFDIPFTGRHFTVQIARPIEKLTEEITDLLIIFCIGFVAAAGILILAGYIVAGRILQPIREINATAREISAKTLDKRIPLGKQQDELYDLSSSLNAMFDRLHFSFRRQKEFLANAAHELKTPLTMLRLSLDEAHQFANMPELYQQSLENQDKILLRMQRLIKSLLDLSALELAETCEMEEFSFNQLVAEVAEDFQPLLCDLHIDYLARIADDIPLLADKEKIKQVLINLFDNAIKYNSPEGEIRLDAALTGKKVVFDLFNTGPGIPAADREKVFEQFYRVEKSRATALGGAGLGLTIVKRIVSLHKGEITMQSKPGEWTNIRISIPNHPEI